MSDDGGETDHEAAVSIPIEDAIDLHAFHPRDVVSVVDEYLRAARAAGFAIVRLIHGRGKGVQRAAVQRLLATHADVAEFWDAPETQLGATLVKLRSRDSDPRAPWPSP
jgi:DNA-nicking Smr family endonuclease